MKKIIAILLLSIAMPVRASVIDYGTRDSLSLVQSSFNMPPLGVERAHTFWNLRTTQVGLGLVGSGLVLSAADLQTRTLRGDYLPTFRYKYDDYLQFSPAVAMVAMKALGVESRSSWGRMVVSSGISTGLMLSTVYAVKYGLGRLRPDGSTYNSFPSGHTAMAFTSATMLHKEYGYLSPWVSIAGYSVATITGISRALNNRHWLSDIVVGAGVGILSTELGYLIADKLFKNRGLVRPVDEWEPVRVGRKPSYVGVGIAHNVLLYDTDRYERVTPSGIGFSVEGAWFVTPKIGVGGVAKVGRYANIVERNIVEGGSVASPKALNSHSVALGLFLSQPLGADERFHLGAKALVGVAQNQSLKNSVVDGYGNDVATIEYSTTEHFTAVAGISLRRIVADNLGVRIYADYNYQRTDWGLSTAGTTTSHSAYLSPLTFGVAVDALLW